MIVRPNDRIDKLGRWVRCNYESLNVAFFGAFGKNTNETIQIQAAIDFAASLGYKDSSDNLIMGRKGALLIPKGNYLVDSLTLRNNVSLIGEVSSANIIANSDSINNGLITLSENEVTGVNIEGLNFVGNDKNIKCFYIEGSGVEKGGLWQSRFSNISIINFKNHAFHFKGSENVPESQAKPNQFLSFENVRVKRKSISGINALKIENQCGQFNFLNCSFDGENIFKVEPKSWNVVITGPSNRNGRPAIIKFDTCTFQNSIGGIFIENSDNIQIENCWFENLDVAIQSDNSRVVNIQKNRFANATDYGGLQPDPEQQGHGSHNLSNDLGFILNAQNNSFGTFEENYIAGLANTITGISNDSTFTNINNYPPESEENIL